MRFLSPPEVRRNLAYYLDLTVLLTSELNSDVRAVFVDEKRAHVDIYKQDFLSHMSDLTYIFNKFKEDNNWVLVTPSDYTDCYNTSDAIVTIFNKKSLWDLPHLQEMKILKSTTNIDQKMSIRFERQKKDMLFKIKKYNQNLKLFKYFMLKNTYLKNKQVEIFAKLKSGEGEIVIDKVFSLVICGRRLLDTNDYWYCNVLNEKHCSAVLPIIFRGVCLNFLHRLETDRSCLYIRVNRKEFISRIGSCEKVTKVGKHHSIYHSYIEFGEKGKLSIANVIHWKFGINTVIDILNDFGANQCIQHGQHGTFELNEV